MLYKVSLFTECICLCGAHLAPGQGYGTRQQVEGYLKELESGGKALAELRAAGTIKAVGAGCNHFSPEQQCDEFARRIADIVDLDFFLIAGAHYSELPGCHTHLWRL
jgi:hypothetical protein